MCESTVDIKSATAENMRPKKKKEDTNHSGKIECLHLLRRAAIQMTKKEGSGGKPSKLDSSTAQC